MMPGDPEIVWEDGRSDFDEFYPSTESYKLSAVSCFSCFLAADLLDFPNL